MWWTMLAVLSCLIFFLLAYVRWLLNGMKKTSEELESISVSMQKYVAHVKSLYEMEMFYGDQTLKSLMDHGEELIETLSQIDIYIDDPGEEDLETEG